MNGSPGWLKNILRSLFSALDSFGYWILAGVYNIFFAVSSAEIISGDVVREFFMRIQLILGVIMVFKLTFTALSIIINPDTATDKQKGAGKILARVAASLVMLTLVVPISIPDPEEGELTGLNARIRDQGILFGFLYQFQDSVVKDNILGKLILGSRAEYNKETEDGSMNAGGEIDNMADVGGVMAATVAKAFISPTILSSADEDSIGSLNDVDMNSNSSGDSDSDVVSDAVSDVISGGMAIAGGENEKVDPSTVFACADTTAFNYYMNSNASADGILYYLNETCDSADGEVYVFNYTILGGLACSILMTIIILGFTIDVAVRAIKLAVLRLIAPVPIISYISPGSEKDGAFGNWVKTLISTYLDLFIRLAIIYFGAYLILLISRSFSGGGFNIIQTDYGFVINTLATIFIIIGVLIFMKQAPKFLKDVLGLKGTPMGNAGISGMLGGVAAFLGGAGLAGAGAAAISGLNMGAEAAAQGKAIGFGGWAQGRDLAAQIKTGDPKAKGGLINSVNDRLMRGAGVRVARRKYGVTAAGLAQAKQQMYDRQAEAAKAKDLYDRFAQGHMDDYERAQYARDNHLILMGSREEQDEIIRNDMYNKMARAQTAASKAESSYKDAKQFGDSHRISPSFEEEHRRSILGEKRDNIIERPDMYNARGRGKTAHQTLGDRILGSRKDWDNPASERTENRWNPNGDRTNIDNNPYVDTPYMDVGTPEAGGPPRGGPGGPRP